MTFNNNKIITSALVFNKLELKYVNNVVYKMRKRCPGAMTQLNDVFLDNDAALCRRGITLIRKVSTLLVSLSEWDLLTIRHS